MTDSTEASPLTTYLLATITALMLPTLAEPDLARRAAREAIDAYQPRGRWEDINITQILAFALTTLDTLRLSMADTVSTAMKLKLRGNANGLNRSARDNTHILEQARRTAPAAAVTAGARPGPTAEIRAPEPRRHADWETAMKTVAARLRAAAATASPARQEVNALWAESLTTVAHEIAAGQHRPATGKAGLLRTTLMANGQMFPSHLGTPVKRPNRAGG
jgi:hypothetical protein